MMHIRPELSGSKNEEIAAPRSTRSKDHDAPMSTESEQAKPSVSSPALPNTEATSSVTLERDTDGKFFYRVTNSRTGELIMEFPPEAVRTVSKGIEEYVQQHARSTKKLEAKA
jgi:hypothetical protein